MRPTIVVLPPRRNRTTREMARHEPVRAAATAWKPEPTAAANKARPVGVADVKRRIRVAIAMSPRLRGCGNPSSAGPQVRLLPRLAPRQVGERADVRRPPVFASKARW